MALYNLYNNKRLMNIKVAKLMFLKQSVFAFNLILAVCFF